MSNENPPNNLPGPGPGRPKGIPNKATMRFREALNNLLEQCAPQMIGWIERVSQNDPAKALDLMSKLAEYIYPKLSRSEIIADVTQIREVDVTEARGEELRQIFQQEIVGKK